MKLLAVLFAASVLAGAQSFDWSPFLDGGTLAEEKEYKWHVQIHPTGINVNFSGILIDPEWILTCAACINKANLHDLYFGSRNLDLGEEEEGRFKINITEANVFIHPDYDLSQFNEKNIALVKLPYAITYSPYVGSIRLPEDGNSTFEGITARVTGFGYESTNVTSGTQLLRYADLDVLPDSECRNLKEGQMCAQITTGVGPCRDEGSALFVTGSDGLATAIGVFSYGYAEGNCPGQRTLFTRVSTYLDWILDTIGGEQNSTTERPISTTPASTSTGSISLTSTTASPTSTTTFTPPSATATSTAAMKA